MRQHFVKNGVLRSLACLVLLAGCTQPNGAEVSIVQPGTGRAPRQTDTAGRATNLTPIPRVAVATPPAVAKALGGGIELGLKLPESEYKLLATVADIEAIRAEIYSWTTGAPRLVAGSEILRKDFANGGAKLGFKEIPPGNYELRITAWDVAEIQIGVALARVAVEPGKVSLVQTRLQLVSPKPPTSPSATPSPPSQNPLPVFTPRPTPTRSSTDDDPIPLSTPTTRPVATATARPVATPAPIAPPSPTHRPTATPSPTLDLAAIMREGLRRDLVGANQVAHLTAQLATLGTAGQRDLNTLLGRAGSIVEQILILKAVIAGESLDVITAFAAEIRGVAEGRLLADSTMRDPLDLIQQWQDACGPSLLMAAVGEYDPRYSWEINKSYQVSKVDPHGVNKNLADQQKAWLEEYGGVAVDRGASGGKGIGILYLLNEKLGPITHAVYSVRTVDDVGEALEEIANSLDQGYDVPLRITWTKPGQGEEAAHFMLALAATGSRGSRKFEIHDSFTGKTAWIDEARIKADSFSPIFDYYARLTHHYPASPN